MQCYNFYVKQFLQFMLLQLATVSYFYNMHMLSAYAGKNPEIVCICQKKKFGRMMKCENS